MRRPIVTTETSRALVDRFDAIVDTRDLGRLEK
jgi:hypothetical protein